MPRYTIEEIYYGDKYDVMGNVVRDLLELQKKTSSTEDIQTITELLICKHALLVAKKMHDEGDCISDDGITIVF